MRIQTVLLEAFYNIMHIFSLLMNDSTSGKSNSAETFRRMRLNGVTAWDNNLSVKYHVSLAVHGSYH